jgi:hypothetical protein
MNGFVPVSACETGDSPEATNTLALHYKEKISFRHWSNFIEVRRRAQPSVVVECRKTYYEFYIAVVYSATL